MSTKTDLPAIVADEEKHLKKIDFFGLTDEKIQEYKDNYKGLTITGVEDKDGYKAVTEGLKVLVATRNKLDKHRLAINRYVNDEAKRIQVELTPLETHLKGQKDLIDAKVAEIEAEKERVAIQKYNDRTTALLESGYKWDTLVYQLGTSVLTPDMVKAMADDVFDKIINAAKANAGEIKKQKEAQQKIEAELKKERDELAAKKMEIALQEEMLEKKGKLMERQAAGEIKSFKIWTADGKVHFTTEFAESKPIVSNTISSVSTNNTNSTVEENEEDPERAFYNDGFNYCKDLVIKILNDPEKITRQILIDKVTTLKP